MILYEVTNASKDLETLMFLTEEELENYLPEIQLGELIILSSFDSSELEWSHS